MVNKWTRGNSYYIAKAINREIDNPDQRIANDINQDI
ncbi:hypothetical protein [Rickettsiales endosymbiont of Trichoplax sp. H2]